MIRLKFFVLRKVTLATMITKFLNISTNFQQFRKVDSLTQTIIACENKGCQIKIKPPITENKNHSPKSKWNN